MRCSPRRGRGVSSAGRQPGSHVRVRADGVRLRAHRKLPHVSLRWTCCGGTCASSGYRAAARHEHHRRGRQDHPQRGGAGVRYRRVHAKVSRRHFWRTCRRSGIEQPEMIARATEHIPRWRSLSRSWLTRILPTAPRMGRGTSASRGFRSTASCRRRILRGSTDGARIDADEYEKDDARDFALWKAPKPGEPSGRRRSGRGGRAGTSSARPWRWSIWETASTCTRAART